MRLFVGIVLYILARNPSFYVAIGCNVIALYFKGHKFKRKSHTTTFSLCHTSVKLCEFVLVNIVHRNKSMCWVAFDDSYVDILQES